MNKQYIQLIADLRKSITQSRYVAARLANREQLILYFRTGKMLAERISAEQWGSKIVEQIAIDLQKELPGLKGFSRTNLMNMKKFFIEYQSFGIVQSVTGQIRKVRRGADNVITQSVTAEIRDSRRELPDDVIGQSVTAQLDAFFGISFTHHIMILNKCKSREERFFYMAEAAAHLWSVNTLEHYIDADQFAQQGKLPNNFERTVAEPLKPSALQVFQDEYLMDFLSTDGGEDERDLEGKVVADIKNFILRMGKGFCFIGNQYRLEPGGEEFFVDLLFYNRHLRCLVAFELKRGKFKPEYAGQLNFYLNVLDEKVRLPEENPSIGIVLCKEKNNTVVEFAVRSIDKAMGVATYKTSKEAPKEMQGILPDTDELVKLL